MLYLLFRIRSDRYAIAAPDIIEVLPMVRLKSIVNPPPGVVGIFNYHGTAVPVIDLTLLATGMQAPHKMTTRLALVKYDSGNSEDSHNILGVLAEQLTETLRAEPGEFSPAGVDSPSSRYLGPVMNDSQGIIQRIEIQQLFPEELRANLFNHALPGLGQCTQ